MAIEIKDAGLKFRSAIGYRPTTGSIVLHHAAASGSVEAIHSAHLNRGWIGIGYHYYVRKDGSIWRGRPEDTVGAHTVGKNYSSVGICFEGNFEVETMTPEQISAGHKLISDIHSRYPGIPISGHRDHDSTACPGKNFPQELLDHKEVEDMTTAEFIKSLSDKEAYDILEKAQRHAATLPAPNWAKEELGKAADAGITDGENPMQLVPRYQAAIMSARAGAKKAR